MNNIIKTYRIPKHQMLSILLSLLLLILALVTLWLGHWFKAQVPDNVEIRELTIAFPPPPPPTPPVQQEVIETTLTIEIQGTGITVPKLDVKQPINPIKPDAPTLNHHDIQWQDIDMNWDAFDLNQLDVLPTLLTPLRVTLPKSLRRKGINKVLIKLDILIDVNGQVSLINIVENPYPELAGSIHKLINTSRFSAPTKNEEAVKARFIWPVEIKS